MNSKVLKLVQSKISIAVAGVAIIAFYFIAVLAHAQAIPTVETVVRDGSNNPITSANIGSLVHDSVTVASTTGPTPVGTVDFNLYSNTTCSGVPTVQAGVLLVSGTVESVATTVPATGLSYKVHYNGQGDVYAPADGICESLTAKSNSTTITGALSTTTSILVGQSVYESATLAGLAVNATGTVAYNIYTNNTCTSNFTSAGSKTVTNGTVANSDTVQFNTVGTFYWQASYSGDQNNSGAVSSCKILSVLPIPTPTPTPVPTPTPTPGTASISGTSYNDLDRDLTRDTGEPGLAGWTIKLYKGNGLFGIKHNAVIATTTTDANGNYSFANLADGKYSVEQIIMKGWIQETGDFKNVTISGSTSVTNLNFADATSTKKNNKHEDKKEDKEDRKEERRENKELFKRFKDFCKRFKINR